MLIRSVTSEDWPDIARIWQQGIDSKISTFRAKVTSWDEWNNAHDLACRRVAVIDDHVVAWAAITPHGGSFAYHGVGEISIYVDSQYHHRGIATSLLQDLINCAEQHEYWMMEAIVLSENKASLALFSKCGFRMVGRRELICCTPDNIWHDSIIMEYRSHKLYYHV